MSDDAQLIRQMRFGAFLQTAAAVMFGVAFVARVIGSGPDWVGAVFLLLAVGTGAAAVALRRKAAELQAD